MGGGKSFSAVARMIDHIAAGGVVYSNILLKLDPWFNPSYDMQEFIDPAEYPEHKREFRDGALVSVRRKNKDGADCFVYNSRGARYYLEKFRRWRYQDGQFNYIPDDQVGPDLMKHLPMGTVERPVLVILDEALDHFEGACNNTNAEFRSFLRHVRKLGINLIFIAQDFGSLEKKIRVLVHYVWIFKDLKTWPVPVVGSLFSFGRSLVGLKKSGALPPPWSDNIHTRQYHAKQYGLPRAEPINRVQYVYRDPYIFQCYQSVSLHNSKIQMAGTAVDFGDSGRIKKESSKVKPFERIIIYALLVAALYFSFRKSGSVPEVAPITNQPVRSATNFVNSLPPAPVPVQPVERVSMFYVSSSSIMLGTECGNRTQIYRLGEYIGGRQIVAITDRSVTFRGSDGQTETRVF
jgi:hypothetical protein